MSAPRLLLIKPRWMTRRSLDTRLATLRKEHPDAQITLLADAQPDNQALEWVPLPDLWRDPRPLILKTVRQLRHVRYHQALILTDDHGGDLGSRELRFWAFAARAGERRVEGGEPLRLLDPAILRVLAATVVRRFLTLRGRGAAPPARPSAARREALLETSLYLNLSARHLPQPGRYLEVGCGAGWGLESAARHGWQPVGLEQNPALAQKARGSGLDVRDGSLAALPDGEAFRLIRLIAEGESGTEELAAAACHLEPGGVLLIRFPWQAPEGKALLPALTEALRAGSLPFSAPEGLALVSARASLAGEGRVDAWFRREGPRP